MIDTGVYFQHPDLNVVGGVTCAFGGPFNTSCPVGGDDNHYHSNHVAGTIGAIDNSVGVVGVAPGARIFAVKALNSRGCGYHAETVNLAHQPIGHGYGNGEDEAAVSPFGWLQIGPGQDD